MFSSELEEMMKKQRIIKRYYINNKEYNEYVKEILNFFTAEELIFFEKMYKEAEKKGNILGTHSTNYRSDGQPESWTKMHENTLLKDVFENGLKNYGGTDLGLTVVPYTKFIAFMHTMACNTYKSTEGSSRIEGTFITEIPKEYLELTDKEPKPIYIPTDEFSYRRNVRMHRLMPEYIKCYFGYDNVNDISKYNRINIDKITKNPNYSDTHNYNNDGLAYESKVQNKLQENTKTGRRTR
jgi:hypothetical protein